LLTVELKHDHCRLPIADFRFNEMQLKSTEIIKAIRNRKLAIDNVFT